MCVKTDLKIPTRLGKMSENRRGDFFDSHCIYLFIYLRTQHSTSNIKSKIQ